MKTKGTIDRIEGEVAVVEVGSTLFDLPVASLPAGAGEGDTITIEITISEKRVASHSVPTNPEIIDL